MRLCSECIQDSETWSHQTAPPGRCGQCGRAFDVQGMPLHDESITCPIHNPILASCPHTSADTDDASTPAVSWLVDEADRLEGGAAATSRHEVQ